MAPEFIEENAWSPTLVGIGVDIRLRWSVFFDELLNGICVDAFYNCQFRPLSKHAEKGLGAVLELFKGRDVVRIRDHKLHGVAARGAHTSASDGTGRRQGS
jgi:hypothetical protein